MAMKKQQILLVIYIKNKYRGRPAELINSRDTTKWTKTILENHFGEPRDLSSLMQDLHLTCESQIRSPFNNNVPCVKEWTTQ